MFQSDFKFVAQYFVQKRLHHDYQPSDEMIVHVDALLKMFAALTGDRRYEFISENVKKEGGSMGMCEILDKIEARGEAKGRAEGRTEGRIEGRTEGRIEGRAEGRIEGRVLLYHELGKSVEFIARQMNLTEDKVREILSQEED